MTSNISKNSFKNRNKFHYVTQYAKIYLAYISWHGHWHCAYERLPTNATQSLCVHLKRHNSYKARFSFFLSCQIRIKRELMHSVDRSCVLFWKNWVHKTKMNCNCAYGPNIMLKNSIKIIRRIRWSTAYHCKTRWYACKHVINFLPDIWGTLKARNLWPMIRKMSSKQVWLVVKLLHAKYLQIYLIVTAPLKIMSFIFNFLCCLSKQVRTKVF